MIQLIGVAGQTCHSEIPKLSYDTAKCRACFIGEVTVAIHKHVASGGAASTIPVPDFSFSPNDSLAQMIVDAWVDPTYQASLLQRDPTGNVTDAAALLARVSLAERGIYLNRAVVISEDEYNNDYTVPPAHTNDELVFVLPNASRVTPRPGQSLLDTARLLMAATPNGI
jgi:hypothetical protein